MFPNEGTKLSLDLDFVASNIMFLITEKVAKLTINETSKLCRLGLNRSIKQAGLTNITITNANLQRQPSQIAKLLVPIDFLLINAPHRGLGNIVQSMTNIQSLPKLVLYVSTHPHLLVKDGESLQKLGYKLTELEGIDQFPNTPKCEWIAVWVQE